MRIYSQNVTNYEIPIPPTSILRINLAWCDSISALESILKKHTDHEIFLDLPIKRIKPPNNKYSIEDLIPIVQTYSNIKYFAISNVTSPNDIELFASKLPKSIIIVPKIESPQAVLNIETIVSAIPSNKKIVMLDHDDLFSALVKNNENVDNFKKYIEELSDFCVKNNVILLRTIGVIFSDEEKRITSYIK